MRSGRLTAGTRLPSSRELARDLDVSRGVVVTAYEQLTAEGFLVARRGDGTRVAPTARPVGTVMMARPSAQRPRCSVPAHRECNGRSPVTRRSRKNGESHGRDWWGRTGDRRRRRPGRGRGAGTGRGGRGRRDRRPGR
ncbi:MAG: winged helix-turn-helix domain-containing protein [Actinomadura sp.]